jgi:hypothetical protein
MRRFLLLFPLLWIAHFAIDRAVSTPARRAAKRTLARICKVQAKAEAAIEKGIAGGRIYNGQEADAAGKACWLANRDWAFRPEYDFHHTGMRSWERDKARARAHDLARAWKSEGRR